MKFSEAWLRQWVNPSLDSDELLFQMTMAGLEVDGTEPAAQAFSGVVVGEIISAEQHPDADKLQVCQVSNGSETFQVVCGAPNARAGLVTAFAQVGAVLPGNFNIKKAKLRGVESFGMLCSAQELGLGDDADGIVELNHPVGSDLAEIAGADLPLDDLTVDVDLTPNRGDCLSLKGLAREVGVLNNLEVTYPQITPVPAVTQRTFPVTLEAVEQCPRYLGRVIEGVDLGQPSPSWLTERLRRCGLRSIDPVVDVTNYVLIELGQPMHAFDLDRLDYGDYCPHGAGRRFLGVAGRTRGRDGCRHIGYCGCQRARGHGRCDGRQENWCSGRQHQHFLGMCLLCASCNCRYRTTLWAAYRRFAPLRARCGLSATG